ncbi:hypothetical protein Bcav_3039 [Beutenbergia cavernae DSM 12333]|uniref:DUF3817 domain-containing protein n=1 Tax=Beutenbergia cavernae (strain ATCC BAA-8 / DSM 12333 / CCUG 43141 / JCM 11478 / NBRC 16432 / NCIMB 13614 / HKI 0122) TaxID=471853 RepID=C5BZV3_BEUC1|nr:DUF3817 domain-containing protein [Beutenbergia cavernae]ACQ81283.1 hypothetical protein Bcav_3039 [Beutenbergia cavernae DSM 12333]
MSTPSDPDRLTGDEAAAVRAEVRDDATKVRSAFGRYRIMAFVTGGMLLLLCLEMLLKYVFHASGVDPATGAARPVIGNWIAIVHGWIYVIYAVTVFDLWSRMRWTLGRLAVMIAGGIVPVLSFVVEHRAKGWVAETLAQRSGAATEG